MIEHIQSSTSHFTKLKLYCVKFCVSLEK